MRFDNLHINERTSEACERVTTQMEVLRRSCECNCECGLSVQGKGWVREECGTRDGLGVQEWPSRKRLGTRLCYMYLLEYRGSSVRFWRCTCSFTCRSSCPLLFHLFSFLTLIVINISPGKKTTYIFILTNILFLFGYRVLKFGMTFLSHFVIHLLFLVTNINWEIIFNHYKFNKCSVIVEQYGHLHNVIGCHSNSITC